jgi:hypothetical protein
MKKEDLAAMLNGRQYRKEMTKTEEREAKDAGLVVVFGASDDLMEFRGAVCDEVGAYDGGDAYFTKAGLLVNDCDNEDCPHFAKAKEAATIVEARWDDGGYSWICDTTIPHATFEIMEDDEKYCRGIVFALADVP